MVTTVRAASDERENIRRINEEERRRVRRQVHDHPFHSPHLLLPPRYHLSSMLIPLFLFQNLDTEARVSAKRNAAVAMRWSSILEKDIPEEILAEMMLQKEECDRIGKYDLSSVTEDRIHTSYSMFILPYVV